jgi:SAM-dependent methyltransferase
MVATELRRELSRRYYVSSRTARAGAIRLAYMAYAATLNRGVELTATREAVQSLRRRMELLLEEDWQDAEAGLYPRALIDNLPWREYVRAAPRLLADLPRARSRILREDFNDLPADAEPGRYPRYYARNFHYQTEGYLGHTSAALYDLQVELLFGGTADAMRRRLIPPVVRFARSQGYSRARPLRVLDVACGTGHLLSMLGAALPAEARLTGVDLSPHYIARARETLPRELDVSLVCDNAERLPFVDRHFDAVTNVFLLHEVPGDVRAPSRPGGLLVVADSIQLSDAPELTKELLAFPDRFHEPYYVGYVKDNLAASVRAAGLHVLEEKLGFLTKIVTAERPRD